MSLTSNYHILQYVLNYILEQKYGAAEMIFPTIVFVLLQFRQNYEKIALFEPRSF